MLIAIDHGNKQVKTVHGNAIVSGVQKSKTRPYGRDVLKYSGSYYTLSAQRIPYQKDKTTDERFFMGHTPNLQKEEPSISSPPIDLIASALADFRG